MQLNFKKQTDIPKTDSMRWVRYSYFKRYDVKLGCIQLEDRNSLI